MSLDFPLILVWGQSFVNRLCVGLERGFAATGSWRFNLASRARVILFDQGGRTVPKLWSHDLHVVSRSPLDIAILEIGTYDLSTEDPALVALSIEVSVRFLHDRFSVKVIRVCHVISSFAMWWTSAMI